METSLVKRIVCLAAAIVVTVDGVTVLADYALAQTQPVPLAAASLGGAHLATGN
jgi:hypothetical protein